MTDPGILVNGTDLTRYDRTIDLESMGEFFAAIQYRGDDATLPGMPGKAFGGRVADARTAHLTLELVGTSAANTWPATFALQVAQWHTNLGTLKTLLGVTAATITTPLTITANPAGTTCLAVCTSLVPTMRTDFWADVALEFDLIEGTL